MPSSKGPAVLWALILGDVQMSPMQLEAQENEMMKSAISTAIMSITVTFVGLDVQFLHCYLLYITQKQRVNLHKIIMQIT